MARIAGHLAGVNHVVWSPDGTRLASSSWEVPGAIRIWAIDQSRGLSATALLTPGFRVRAVFWSPDGTRLAACGEDDGIRFWQAPEAGQWNGRQDLSVYFRESWVRLDRAERKLAWLAKDKPERKFQAVNIPQGSLLDRLRAAPSTEARTAVRFEDAFDRRNWKAAWACWDNSPWGNFPRFGLSPPCRAGPWRGTPHHTVPLG